jgi:hypothetical protein
MKILFSAAALAWMAATSAAAGVVFELETRGADGGGAPGISHIYVQGQRLRMDRPPQDQEGFDAVLFDADRGEMTILDSGQKRYTVIDEAARDRMAARMASAMQQYRDMLASVPEAQRKMMEQMMPAAVPRPRPAPEVRRTGRQADHGGYPCAEYEVLQEGVRTQELWVTGWDGIPGSAGAAEVFRKMADFFSSVRDAMAGAGPMGGPEPGTLDALMKEVDGYPVVARVFDDGGRMVEETRLRAVREEDLAPSLFEPPADYGPQALEGL